MKKLLTLFTALLLFGSMTVVQAATTRIYCKMEYNWWAKDGARIGIILDSGTPTAMTLVDGSANTWYADVNLSGHTTVKFRRIANNSTTDWGAETTAQNIASNNVGTTNNFFTITNSSETWSGNSKYCTGTWGTYVYTPPTIILKGGFNGWGNSDVFTDNGSTATFTKTISAGTYGMKIMVDGQWKNNATTIQRANSGTEYDFSGNEGSDCSLVADINGDYTFTYTYATKKLSVTFPSEPVVLPPATIKLHSNITNPSWESSAAFTLAGNEETTSLTLTGVTKGSYEFGVKINESWTANGSAFTRANPSHAITSGSGNCTFNADRNGDYTFTWTYATNTLAVTYPAIPSQSVSFTSLASQILKGSVINLANCVTSSSIDEPTYRFYIKEKNGSYGDAINANYNFNTNGEYVVKVEALEYGEPVAFDESNVVVYQSYTFTNGSTIYVDFRAMTEGTKGVNYPKANEVGLDYDAAGAGTIKTVTFSANVTWNTMAEVFIKTEKAGWANLPFIVPGTGQNCAVVAADGASYTWTTIAPPPPTIKMHGNFFGDWNTTNAFVLAGNEETASLTLTNIAKGSYQFGVRIGSDDNWTSNGSAFTRVNAAHEIVSGEGNCTFTADVAGDYTFTWTYETNTLSVTYPAPPTVIMGGKFFSDTWANTDEFNLDVSENFATITLNAVPKGTHEFKVILDGDDWRSTAGTFTRANNSAAITGNESNNMIFTADIVGNYIFKWTYASNTLEITYPALPDQSVSFDGLEAQILKGITPTVFAATSTGITNPTYTYYVKPKGGEYGAAVASYTFNTIGEYVVKVSAEGDNTIDPVEDEENVVVYETHTFTAGTRIYIDFTAMSEVEDKGVNYPSANAASAGEYDAAGAGTFKTVRFSENVTWSTSNDFIKTQNGGWDPGMKFTVPAEGQNKVIVAADGASYTWGTYTPETVQVKFFAPRNETHKWEHVYAYSWDDAGAITGWTSDEVTRDGEWYVYDVQVGANLLFHNNNSMQTNDINNITTAKCYVSTAINDGVDPQKVTVTEQCTVDYYIAGVKALVGGESDWNTNVALDENNQIVFHDLAAGSYEFKINNGTWAWSIGGNDFLMSGECASIATTEGLGNVGFTIDEVQDVTITYYPATRKICLGAVTVKAEGTVSVENMRVFVDEEGTPAITTNMADTTDADVSYTIISGGDYISISDGKIIGVAEGEAEVRINIEETTHYLAATNTFTVKVAPLAMYLVGDFNEWVPGDVAYKFTVAGDLATLDFTVAADSAEYEFKLYDKLNDNEWMGANYNFNYYWNTDVEFSKEEETNAKLYAFKAGTYTFKYTISTNKLTIHFKETDATEVAISQYEYATLYSTTGFDVPDEVEAYIITGLDGIHLTTERIYRIPANTGVLLHAPQGNYDFYEGDSRYMGVDVSANMMKGTVADQEINNELVHYILSLNSENVVGLYWPYGTGANYGVGSFENKAGKAYLEIPAASQPQSVVARRGFPLSPGAGMPTGIEMTNDQLQITNKRIVNGQLYIILDGATYNAQGARVQ